MNPVKLFFIVFVFLLTTCSNENNPIAEDKEEEIIEPVVLTELKILQGNSRIEGLGNKLKLNVQAIYSDSTIKIPDVNWKSDNTDIVTIDFLGSATSVSFGEAKITAEFENRSGEIIVTVEKYSRGGDYIIQNGTNVLGGTLDLPGDLSKPVPAFVYVHGSGPSTRQEGTLATARLLPKGIAVVRYDKRGHGLSTGEDLSSVGTFNGNSAFDKLSNDAIKWVEFLKQHKLIDANKIGIIGVSQAGWIMPVAANKSSDIKYMVNIVGPAVTIGEEIFYSSLTGNAPGGNNNSNYTDEQLDSLLAEYSGAHGFNPQTYLDNLSIPVIWVLGEKDYSIPVPKTTRILQSLINDKQKDIELIIKPNANHSMIDINTGSRVDIWNGNKGILEWVDRKVLQ